MLPAARRPPPRLRPRGVVLPAVGPCMFLAPVVFLVGVVALLCWPFVVLAAVPLWMLVWPLERALVALGVPRAHGLFDATTRVMRLVARPWTYYDVPAGTTTPSATRELPRTPDEPSA